MYLLINIYFIFNSFVNSNSLALEICMCTYINTVLCTFEDVIIVCKINEHNYNVNFINSEIKDKIQKFCVKNKIHGVNFSAIQNRKN